MWGNMNIINFIIIVCALVVLPMFIVQNNYAAAMWAGNCAIWCFLEMRNRER
jgi:hypothetical protein